MTGMIPFPDISPEIFTITVFGWDFALRWYAMAYIVGILLGWRLAIMAVRQQRLWAKDGPPMTPAQVDDLLTWLILGVILGGRLGYVIFYKPMEYLANPIDILKVWEGGMAFHGGLLGVILAAWIYTRQHQLNRLSSADVIALAVPPGLLLGRIANFINAELWGRPTDLPWGVAFPGQFAQNCPDVVGICARHPSQLYEAALEGLILGAIMIWLVWRRGALKRPGLISGVFFAGYGIGRFLVEFVRQPDPQFISPGNPLGLAWHIQGYGLTMGQILSVPMIALGLWLVLRAQRQARSLTA